jgi:polyhydroxybutyrate depolymerase
MTSRFWTGTGILAAVTAGVGGTAIAQDRMQMFERLREHAGQRRSKPADPNPTPIGAPGDYRFSFIHDGLTREYLVHVPTSYRPNRATPMLLALHGGGGDSDFQADDSKYGLIAKSEQAGFIAVFPNGYSRFRSGILATWNAGTCCGAAQKNKIDDVGFLKDVILRVERQANVDKRRVFATGMSNGGLMSYRLACELPDMIRAIAPVAGTDNTIACKPSRPVPVIHFHAVDDDHVLFNGGSGKKALSDTGFTAVPTTIAKWVAIDRADPKARRVLTVPGAHCDLHAAQPGGAPVELCVTDSGGHSWPGGGSQQGRKQPSMAINANDLMWDFFSAL